MAEILTEEFHLWAGQWFASMRHASPVVARAGRTDLVALVDLTGPAPLAVDALAEAAAAFPAPDCAVSSQVSHVLDILVDVSVLVPTVPRYAFALHVCIVLAAVYVNNRSLDVLQCADILLHICTYLLSFGILIIAVNTETCLSEHCFSNRRTGNFFLFHTWLTLLPTENKGKYHVDGIRKVKAVHNRGESDMVVKIHKAFHNLFSARQNWDTNLTYVLYHEARCIIM